MARITDTVMKHPHAQDPDVEAERQHQQFIAECRAEYITLQELVESRGWRTLLTKLQEDELALLEKLELTQNDTVIAKLVGSLLACKGQQRYPADRMKALAAVINED